MSTTLSDRVKLKLGTKSGIVRCLEDTEEQHDITPSVEVVVLDLPVILYVLEAAPAIHYHEYALLSRVKHIKLTPCGTNTDQII